MHEQPLLGLTGTYRAVSPAAAVSTRTTLRLPPQAIADIVALQRADAFSRTGKTTGLKESATGTAVAGRVAPKIPGADAGSFVDLVSKEPGNFIFLFNTRSNAHIDWSTPGSLARTTTVSTILDETKRGISAIGHAQVGWVYEDAQGNRVIGATGQTGQSGSEGRQAVLKGWGLNVLETVFLDGRLESKDDVLATIKKADKNGDFSWLAIKTDDATTRRLVEFVKQYEKSGAPRNYGFPVDPRNFEGGGCTSFAEAAFEKAGLGIPLFEASKRALNMPSAFVGVLAKPVPNTRPPQLAASPSEEKKVPPLKIVLGRTAWAAESEPHQDFWFYDPELYHESVVNMENVYRQKANLAPKAVTRTRKLDPDQVRVKETSEKWLDSLLKRNVPVKLGSIHHTTGLIIDLTKATSGPN